MLEDLAYLLAIVAVVVGTLFSVIAIVGLVRLPDVYARMHATGKVATFGVILLAVASAVLGVTGWGKALVFVLLIVLAGPVVSHAIGSAAYRIGIPMKNPVRDDLAAKKLAPPAQPD